MFKFMFSPDGSTPHRYSVLVATVAVLLCVSSTAALAQNTTDGSLFSRFGVGELRTAPSSQLDAMGGAGTGSFSLNYVNHDNPASWGYQVLTRASVGARYQNILIEDGEGQSSRLQGGSLNSFELSFPLLEQRLGVAFTFSPYSRMNYSTLQTGELTGTPISDDPIQFQTSFEGSGGLQQVRGGVGWRLNDNLSVGVNASMLFGLLEQSQETIFSAGAGLEPTTRANATQVRGFTGTAGILYAIEDALADGDVISLGATFTLPTRLSGDRTETLGTELDRDTLSVQRNSHMDLPMRAQLGVAYQPDERWLGVADVLYEPWTDFSSDFTGFPVPGTTLEDRWRYSGGVEFTPAGDDDLAGFLSRVSYRLGGYFDSGYASPTAQQSISTTALTGGLSLPTMASGTRIDLGFSAGRRGTLDNDLVRDTFYTVSVTLNIGERWFLRRRLR